MPTDTTEVRPLPRNDQIERQWRVWMILAAARTPLTALELARSLAPHHEAGDRTVRRDLEVLRSIGVPVLEEKKGKTVRYSVADDGPPLRLDPHTLLALRLALGLLRPFQGTLVGQSFEQLSRSLESRIPPRLARHFGALADALEVKQPGAPRYGPEQEQALATIQAALSAGKTLHLDYRALGGERSKREVDPQGLVYGPRGLYLFAHDRGRKGALRTFRVERIAKATVGTRAARRQPDFDPAELLAGSVGVCAPEHPPRLVKVRLHEARVVQLLEENPWHPSQRIVRRNGTWTLSCRLASTRELVSRLLALGPAAEVTEPHSLRKEMANLHSRALGHYRTRSDQLHAHIRSTAQKRGRNRAVAEIDART